MSISPSHCPIHKEIEFWYDPIEKALLYEFNLQHETGGAIQEHKGPLRKGTQLRP